MQMVNHIYLQQCNVERASPKTSKHSDSFKLECIKASQGLTTKQRKEMCESKGIDEQNLYRFKKDLSEGRVVDPSKYMIHRAKERYIND